VPKADLSLVARGAYVAAEPAEVGLNKRPKAVLIATGSELQWALHAQAELAKEKIPVRVVSMPSTSVFDRQDKDYKKELLPRKLPRIAIEAGSSEGWWKYGVDAVIGLDRFGEARRAACSSSTSASQPRTWWPSSRRC
jgi:transketolase